MVFVCYVCGARTSFSHCSDHPCNVLHVRESLDIFYQVCMVIVGERPYNTFFTRVISLTWFANHTLSLSFSLAGKGLTAETSTHHQITLIVFVRSTPSWRFLMWLGRSPFIAYLMIFHFAELTQLYDPVKVWVRENK